MKNKMTKNELLSKICEIMEVLPIKNREDEGYYHELKRMNKQELIDELNARYCNKYGYDYIEEEQ